mgnify:CR=1 FL=1
MHPAFPIGLLLSLAVAVFARSAGFDRDRAFYPTVVIVVASYYMLFAAMSGSVPALLMLDPATLSKFLFSHRPRHESASQFTFMHTTIVISRAGQLSWGTTLAAITNMAMATAIFSISQNMKPTAAAIAFFVPRVIPRAIKAPGSTTDNAP